MNPISAIRMPGLAEIPSMQGLVQGRASGPGGISAEQFEKLASVLDARGVQAPAETSSAGFQEVLGGMVREVQAKQAQASLAMNGVLSGQGVPLHEAVLASEEASVSFQLMVEVRNKLLESYQELMRMQL